MRPYPPAPLPARVDLGASPIARAIAFLAETQTKEDAPCDFAGDWPQFAVSPTLPSAFRARDVSPFLAEHVHHVLAHVVERNGPALGLTPADLKRARDARKRARALVRRFEIRDRPLRGTLPPRELHRVALGRVDDCDLPRRALSRRSRGCGAVTAVDYDTSASFTTSSDT